MRSFDVDSTFPNAELKEDFLWNVLDDILIFIFILLYDTSDYLGQHTVYDYVNSKITVDSTAKVKVLLVI